MSGSILLVFVLVFFVLPILLWLIGFIDFDGRS